MERISNYQLFTMTMLFQVGTTIIFGFASDAGRDAWIAVLLSTFLGALIILVYTILMRMQPGLTLVEWYPAQFGRWLGLPIAWLYVLLFMYDAGRGLADLKYVIATTILPTTPNWVILGLFSLIIAYGLFSGIEVLGRLGEILLPIILLVYAVEVILLFGSGIVHLDNLQPLVDQGWGRIWKSVWPLGITQSFGETIEFAMIWTLTRQPERIMKTTIIATLLSGLLVASADILAIAVLDEGLFQRSMYPLFILIKQISVADFITNLDAIGILYFCITLSLKFCIHMFVVIRSIQLLTHIRDNRVLIMPVSIIVFLLGITMNTNSVSHIYVGVKIIPYHLWGPLFILLPILLLIVAGIRKMWSRRKLANTA